MHSIPNTWIINSLPFHGAIYNSILNAALLILILNIQLLGGTMNKQNFSQKKYVESRNLLTWWQTNGVSSYKQISNQCTQE